MINSLCRSVEIVVYVLKIRDTIYDIWRSKFIKIMYINSQVSEDERTDIYSLYKYK